MKFQICLLLISLALCASTYRVGPPTARREFEGRKRKVGRDLQSLRRTLAKNLHSGKVLSESQYRLMRNKIQNLSVMVRKLGLNSYQMLLNQISDMLEKNFQKSREPLVGNFERYKCVGEYEVFKLLGQEQYYNPNATLYVTIEKTENGYKETWNRDGYIFHFSGVASNNGKEIHTTYSDGREAKFKPSELLDGGHETEMYEGIKSHHKRIYLTNDKYIARHIYSKDGKNIYMTEYYRRV